MLHFFLLKDHIAGLPEREDELTEAGIRPPSEELKDSHCSRARRVKRSPSPATPLVTAQGRTERGDITRYKGKCENEGENKAT